MPSEESKEVSPSLVLRWICKRTLQTKPERQAVTATVCRAVSSAAVLSLGHRLPTGRRAGPTWLPAGTVPRHWCHPWHCLWLCHTVSPPVGSSCLTVPMSLFLGWGVCECSSSARGGRTRATPQAPVPGPTRKQP